MYKIFHTNNVVLSKGFLDDAIVGQRDSLPSTTATDLSETTLVNEFLHALQVRVTVRDVRLYTLQHANRRVVELDEHTILDLAKSQETQNLLLLRWHCVDTTDTNHERHFSALRHVELALLARVALGFDERAFRRFVLGCIGLGALEDLFLRLALLLLRCFKRDGSLGGDLLLRATLFQHALRNSRSDSCNIGRSALVLERAHISRVASRSDQEWPELDEIDLRFNLRHHLECCLVFAVSDRKTGLMRSTMDCGG